MLDYAREAMAMASDRTTSDLSSDRLRQLALARTVDVVGEAASRVSEEGQRRHPNIPWRDILALHDRISRGDGAVDYDIVWRIVTTEFPLLVAALELALPEHRS
jgi:uncharacterized protein with HEPN domain